MNKTFHAAKKTRKEQCDSKKEAEHFSSVPVREHWVQAEVFGRGCWHWSCAGLLATRTPVWLFYGQAGAEATPILSEGEIKILAVWQG